VLSRWPVEYPYRQARSLLRHEIGDEISYRTIHRWAQEEGKKQGKRRSLAGLKK